MEHYQTNQDFDVTATYIGGAVNGIGDYYIEPGQKVIVNFGTGDREATYLGKTGDNCSGDRVIHLRDNKTRKQMIAKAWDVRLAS